MDIYFDWYINGDVVCEAWHGLSARVCVCEREREREETRN